MQTAKHLAPAAGTTTLSQPATADRTTIAREQSALFPTRLALARWTRGGDLPHLYGQAHPPGRAAWFAEAERNFQAWLELGGFTQYDEHPGPAANEDGQQRAGACI